MEVVTVGVGDGDGLVDRDRVDVGVGPVDVGEIGDGGALFWMAPTSAGVGKSCTGCPASAAVIMRCHTIAGLSPP